MTLASVTITIFQGTPPLLKQSIAGSGEKAEPAAAEEGNEPVAAVGRLDADVSRLRRRPIPAGGAAFSAA